jgi:hypothetical protein
VGRWGKADAVEQAVECPAELHRFLRTEAEGFIVNTGEGVVNNGAVAPVPLRNDASRGQTEPFEEAMNEAVGYDSPIAKSGHVRHLSA